MIILKKEYKESEASSVGPLGITTPIESCVTIQNVAEPLKKLLFWLRS